MDPELLKEHPLFSELVSLINKKLSDEKASPKVQKAFDQAQRDLTKARSEWLTNKILHHEIHELLADLEIRGREKTLSGDEEKLRDILTKTLTHAEIPDYLHFSTNATSSSTLFGLKEQDLDRHNPVKNHLPDLLEIIKPKVEGKLNSKCVDLYAYFDPSNSKGTSSDSLLSAKAHSLPVLVEEKKNLLERERTHFKEIRQKRDKQFWSYYQKLLECLSIIETLIKDFKCGNQAETDQITVQHLAALCRATCLKVRSAQLHIMCDTYTVDTVKALKVISGHLDTATSQAKRELSATTQALHAFRRLGPEFSALAAEVAQLQQELQNKRWGLQQFGGGGVEATSAEGASSRSDHHRQDRVDPAFRSNVSESLSTGATMEAMSSVRTPAVATSKTLSSSEETGCSQTQDNIRQHVSSTSLSNSGAGLESSVSSSIHDDLSAVLSAMTVNTITRSGSVSNSSKSQSVKKVTFQHN